MPTESSYGSVDIPNVDLWSFLFERKDREFPDDKGSFTSCYADAASIARLFTSYLPLMCTLNK